MSADNAPVLHIDAAVFDFDYTLADSSRGVIACIAYALDAMGLPQVAPGAACRTIGLSLHDTFSVLTGRAEGGDLFQRLFIAHAEDVMADGTVLLAQTRPVLAWLRARGIPLGIVSTKFRRRICEIMSREGLLDSFAVIVGGEDVSAPKPDPEGLQRAIAQLACERPLYVGDSLTDARTAARAGVPFVAVCTGTTPRAAFEPYTPCAVLDDLSELRTILANARGRTQP